MAVTSRYPTKPMDVPINLQGDDLFTHMLAVGPTRSGKTATILKPIIYNLLLAKKRGIELGISVIEPKGDLAWMVREMAHEMGLDHLHIDPFVEDTNNFNPMEGDANDVSEAMVVVLKGLFGKQEEFFANIQELAVRNVIHLLKRLYGDNFSISDVLTTLRETEVMNKQVNDLKDQVVTKGETPENDHLVQFFENEMTGDMSEHYRKLIIGLRAQLENLTNNHALTQTLTGNSDLQIDEHFKNGGILSVNTNLGRLRKSGDALGQFLIMHLQNGTLRRKGTEKTRVPHFLIVDEYSRYMNPDVEIFLSLAAEYRVAGILATQSLGQLEVESGEISAQAMKRTIMNSCRNKIAFGGLSHLDAQEFAEEFGMDRVIMRQSTYENRILYPKFFPNSYRDTEQEEYRFSYTDIMDGLPRFHFIHKLMEDGTQQQPGVAKGEFVPRDWKERREWEKQNKTFDEDTADTGEKRNILIGIKQVDKNTKRITPRKVRKKLPRLKTLSDDTLNHLINSVKSEESVDDIRYISSNEIRRIWGDPVSYDDYNEEEDINDTITGDMTQSDFEQYREEQNRQIRANKVKLQVFDTEETANTDDTNDTNDTDDIDNDQKQQTPSNTDEDLDEELPMENDDFFAPENDEEEQQEDQDDFFNTDDTDEKEVGKDDITFDQTK